MAITATDKLLSETLNVDLTNGAMTWLGKQLKQGKENLTTRCNLMHSSNLKKCQIYTECQTRSMQMNGVSTS